MQQKSSNGEILNFYYDSAGQVVNIGYKETAAATEVYYFVARNAQGDIIAIYKTPTTASGVGSTSDLVGTYTYDAWGNTTTTVVSDSNGIMVKNPFRYRGYYFDLETGWYYLQSRYYDPEVKRFINADDVVDGVGNGVQGYNVYSYCLNNPVNMSDSFGHWPRWITAIVAIGLPPIGMPALVLQTIHYDIREALNIDLPPIMSDASDADWKSSKKDGPSADLHQFIAPKPKSKKTENIKLVSQDGHREALYYCNGDFISDPRDIGTYNFSPSGTVVGDIGHIVLDVIPYFIFGNNDKDWGPLINVFFSR